jgi:hypothetical protein
MIADARLSALPVPQCPGRAQRLAGCPSILMNSAPREVVGRHAKMSGGVLACFHLQWPVWFCSTPPLIHVREISTQKKERRNCVPLREHTMAAASPRHIALPSFADLAGYRDDRMRLRAVHVVARPPTEAALVERDADPSFFAPDDVAGPLGLSARHKSVKRSGIKSRVTTSSAAPVSERFLTVQSIAPPPNSIVPALRTRFRDAMRFSLMVLKIGFHLLRFRNQAGVFKLGLQGRNRPAPTAGTGRNRPLADSKQPTHGF